MSLAWHTLLLLVLILPGLFFLLGLYSPERYSRDVARRNTLGELGLIVFIALLLHFFIIFCLFVFDKITGYSFISGIIDDFFIYNLSNKYELAYLGRNYWYVFVIYIIITIIIGYFSGYYCGTKVISGPLRFLARHRWLYELIDATKKSASSSVAVFAYVMTKIQYDDRVVMYKGIVQEFFMLPEGKIAHLVLKNCSKFYMYLEQVAPSTTYLQHSLAIKGDEDAGPSQWLYLVIEGDDISNVVFEATAPIESSKDDMDALDTAIAALIQAQAAIAAHHGRR